MTNHEKLILYLVQDKVSYMMENNCDNNYIALYIDNVITKLPSGYSCELSSILYRMHDNLIYGNEF